MGIFYKEKETIKYEKYLINTKKDRIFVYKIQTIMAKGIQKGQVATDAAAKTNDTLLKSVAKILQVELASIEGLTFQRKLRQDQIKSGVGSCEPDGGIWFYNGKPICFFESKKQGKGGNAIERWFKNFTVLSRINRNIQSGTFCVGEGTVKGAPIWKTLHEACDGQFDVIQEGNSVFMSLGDFDPQFVKETIKQIILNSIEMNKLVLV